MADSTDPLKILGLTSDATPGEIKRAYRAAARKHHPDNGGDAWAFQQVQQAYESLQNQGVVGAADDVDRSAATANRASKSPADSKSPQAAESRPTPNSQQVPSPAQDSELLGGLRSWLQAGMAKDLPLQNETTYFILVNVLDIVLTNMLLSSGAIEANPLAQSIFVKWGFQGMIALKLILVAGVCVLAQGIALRSLKHARFVLIAGIVIVGAVVLYSMALFAMLRYGEY